MTALIWLFDAIAESLHLARIRVRCIRDGHALMCIVDGHLCRRCGRFWD